MPAQLQSVSLSVPTPGTLRIAIGSETHDVTVNQLQSIHDGVRDVTHLLWDFFKVLRAAGLNPRTATLAQMKNAIESQQYLWGN